MQLTADPRRVLFVSRRNAARSLMAEAWLHELGGNAFQVESAGLEPAESAEPLAMQGMRDAGPELGHPRSVHDLRGSDYDLVIVLCPRDAQPPALEGMPEAAVWSFDDPAEGAEHETEDERHKRFCHLRAELRTRVSLFVNANTDEVAPPEGVAASTQPAREQAAPVAPSSTTQADHLMADVAA